MAHPEPTQSCRPATPWAADHSEAVGVDGVDGVDGSGTRTPGLRPRKQRGTRPPHAAWTKPNRPLYVFSWTALHAECTHPMHARTASSPAALAPSSALTNLPLSPAHLHARALHDYSAPLPPTSPALQPFITKPGSLHSQPAHFGLRRRGQPQCALSE